MNAANSLKEAYLTLKEKPTIILLFITFAIISLSLFLLYSINLNSISNPTSNSLATILMSYIVGLVLFVLFFILASISVMIAKQKFSGEKILLKKAFNDAKPFFIRTVGLFIVIFLILGIPMGIFIFGGGILFDSLVAYSSIVISLAVSGIVLLIIGIILLVFLGVGVSQSLPISMIENLGIIASIKKSFSKSYKSFWSIFGIGFTIFMISLVFDLIEYLISTYISSLISYFLYVAYIAILYPIVLIAIPIFYLYSNQKPDSNKPKIGTDSASPKISQG